VIAFKREKTAGIDSSGFHKMERAKRLELLRSLLQLCLGDDTYESLIRASAQGDAHTKKAPDSDPKLEAWVAEMEEVIEAWPKIEPTVRVGLMTIVRAHHASVPRISANRMA